MEIGPGRGALTDGLIERAQRIAAVELDPRLAGILRERFGPESLVLVEADVLGLDLGEIVRALGFPADSRLVMAGNLPYNISKPVASKLVRERARVSRAVLTFQREVAERLTATHGTRSYGPLSVLVGQAFGVERLFDLPPGAFRPRPGVFSTVTSWVPRGGAELSPEGEAALRACLAACFARRRQTLLNNLRAALSGRENQARALLEAAAIDGCLRAEAIPPEGFRRLASVWPAQGVKS